MKKIQYSGFIGIIGRPNVGKSTLLNKIVGKKVSITTHKAQTTRNCIIGIRTELNNQIIFVDTPGIHEPEKIFNRKMVSYALKTLNYTDLNLWILEPFQKTSTDQEETSYFHTEDNKILNLLLGKEKRTVLVLNKIDKINKEQLLESISKLGELKRFAEIVPVSALKSINIEYLVKIIKKYLPKHPFYFAENQITDSSERFLVGEFVREEIFLRLQKEIPYSVAVVVEKFEDNPKCIQIACTIFVERESQKGILIGEKGEMLKKIGISSRKKIEFLLGSKVNLDLYVKVLKKWSQNINHLSSLGYS